jgi:DNA excision repair protein ERCC-4
MTLPFHKEIFSELLEEDGLLIMARGLGLHKIFLQFLRFHANSKEIVFALNVPAYLQQLWIEELLELGVSPRYLPKRINAEYTLNERNKMYLEGGVHFITSTILVMDLLYKRLPTHLIGGFLVYNAHTVAETSTESFILRLFRKGNKVRASFELSV